MGIQWFSPEVLRKREKRDAIEEVVDPLYEKQWQLHDDAGSVRADLAWKLGYTGKGVVIAIVDDGVDTKHPDIRENFLPEASYNYNRNIESPDPTVLKGGFGVC